MKILISFLALAIVLNKKVHCSDISPFKDSRFTSGAVIHQLSELVRYLIRSGDVTNGVPVLDPYEFQSQQLHFSREMFSANMNITNGNLSGLGNFQLQEFNFSNTEISIELDIHIPFLEFYSEYYELDGNLYDAVPIRGQGIMNIEIHNIKLWGKVYLKQSVDSKAILLDKIEDPQLNIERIVSRTQFDNNIDDIISSLVEELLAGYLTRFSKYIAASYSDTLVQFLNPTLNKFDTWRLIAVLLSNLNE